MKRTRGVALSNAIAAINKTMGEDTVATLRKACAAGMLNVSFLSTGVYAVDYVTKGGLPRGHPVEVNGPERSGKTTLMLHACAVALSQGEAVLWVDAEKAIDVDWIRANGVDLNDERFVLAQPGDGQEAGNIMHAAISSNEFGLVVLDSIGGLVPRIEVEKGMSQGLQGQHPQM